MSKWRKCHAYPELIDDFAQFCKMCRYKIQTAASMSSVKVLSHQIQCVHGVTVWHGTAPPSPFSQQNVPNALHFSMAMCGIVRCHMATTHNGT